MMKTLIIKIFLLSLLLGFWMDAAAQDVSIKIDSLKKFLLTQKDDTNKVNTLNDLSGSFYLLGNSRNTIQFANEALSLSKKLHFKRGEASAYIRLATGNEQNLPEYLKYSYAALNAHKEAGDKYGIAQSIQGIGHVYMTQGNNIEALKNFTIALEMFDSLRIPVSIAQCYLAIGRIHLKQGKYTESLKMFFAALKIFQQPGMPKWGTAVTCSLIGEAYQLQGDSCTTAGNKQNATLLYSKALSNMLISLRGYQEIGMSGSVASVYTSLASINISLKKFSEAKQYLQKSLQLSKELDDKELLFNLYKSLSTLDSIQGNYKQAYTHYKLQMLYKDSLSNEESKKKFIQTEMQYEFDKKEAIAKEDQIKKDAETKRIKNQQYFAIASLGILVLAVVIIALIQFRNNKQKQKANLLITKQKEKVESTLTELKSTQAQLIQSEKMASLGELTAGIAHEIQNPLNFVNNFSEVNQELVDELQIELKAGNTEEAIAISNDIKDNEQKINHHGMRADAIVKGMLQHSRASTGQKEPTDINALADEYLRLSYHGFRSKDKDFNATMQTEFDKSINELNIIRQDIGRVLLNLYNNAFYAVDEKKKQHPEKYKPTVSVSTKKVSNKIEIKVSDNGNGIPQKVADKIFQPFFTTKPTGQGTGLGLSLSYDIIKAHGGEIKVDTKQGEGSEFIIQIPLN